MNKEHVFLGLGVFFILLSSLIIPNALATGSCSYSSSDWTDQSLCGHGPMTAIIVTTHDNNLESKLAAYDWGRTICLHAQLIMVVLIS
ncbi:MAG: hypothetical protein KGI25_05155 [Thaumarchaeota archaeon]|nr:hypothetical protein [Nitrososphaerota archaeon]